MNTPNYDPNQGSVLIVDDIPENLRLLTDLLSERGYQVRSVSTGRMALKTAQAKPPDVILLDIRMPDMDGYEVCEALQANVRTQDIPIIFISALDEVIDKVRAFDVGGVDYITKPFQLGEVIARLENQLTIRRQQLQLQQEIRKRAETEEILYQSRALLSSILNSSLDGIAALQAVRDPATSVICDFQCLTLNPVLSQLLNRRQEELIGKLCIRHFLQQVSDTLFDDFVQVVETGTPLEQDFYYQRKPIDAWYHFVAVKLGDGFAITVRDITTRKTIELELEEANKTLDALAYLDGLTQVANRRRFDQQMQHEWLRLAREQQPLTLLLFDVDYFKPYNDHYGHQCGDDCLIRIAQAVQTIMKRPADLLARYGGEEFAVILPNTDVSGGQWIANQIQQTVRSLAIPHDRSQVSTVVTVSLGIACAIPHIDGDASTLLRQADRALYLAKKEGRDRSVISSPNCLSQ
ncbi:MAG: diguanylate cyclase [Synechococcales cyanobacterium K44_A2020_017]|jgi:diguanylate cyclase (GGDEF)-like protein|nr:diguanylate cyclase [Synechococcales cyanobacterium K32_A2020_035]MBF2093139.1 diguanylate cyclase [Synechococcales cyanobacterium K44_A2020_017]